MRTQSGSIPTVLSTTFRPVGLMPARSDHVHHEQHGQGHPADICMVDQHLAGAGYQDNHHPRHEAEQDTDHRVSSQGTSDQLQYQEEEINHSHLRGHLQDPGDRAIMLQMTPVQEKFLDAGLKYFSTYLLRTDTKHAPANYVEDSHNSNLCSHHKLLVKDNQVDTVLHVHHPQHGQSSEDTDYILIAYQDNLDTHQPHHLPPLHHDQGGGGEGGHPQLYRGFQVLHPNQGLRALPPTDNSLSRCLAQASLEFSENRIWLKFSRTCSTPAMMLANNTTSGNHSYCSTLCCMMFNIPTHTLRPQGPWSQISNPKNLKPKTGIVDCARHVLFTKMKMITRNRLLNLLQIHLLHHVGIDLNRHSCVDLPVLVTYSMGHPLQHDQIRHGHQLISVIGVGSKQHRGALEENDDDFTGQEDTRTVQVLLGWGQQRHLLSHGLAQASFRISEAETRIYLIGWGQECIMSKHRVSYRLDMMWAFNITIKLIVCLFSPQVGPEERNYQTLKHRIPTPERDCRVRLLGQVPTQSKTIDEHYNFNKDLSLWPSGKSGIGINALSRIDIVQEKTIDISMIPTTSKDMFTMPTKADKVVEYASLPAYSSTRELVRKMFAAATVKLLDRRTHARSGCNVARFMTFNITYKLSVCIFPPITITQKDNRHNMVCSLLLVMKNQSWSSSYHFAI